MYSLSRSLYRKVSIERLILALVIILVVGVSDLIYIGVVGLEGFYIKAFRQGFAVKI